jgi:uncharacterized protein (TIGR02246 family)
MLFFNTLVMTHTPVVNRSIGINARGRAPFNRPSHKEGEMTRCLTVFPAFFLALATTSPAKATSPRAEEAAIRRVVADMETAWNRGDFAGYMAAFKNPDVVFVSKGRFQQGWQGTLDHYIRDYGGDPVRRGRLHFWDVRVEILAPDAAQLISRYRLEGGGKPQDGINTRLFRKVRGRWVIALNHVSSAE